MAKNRALYQLKVTLRETHPPIWRHIQVWDDTTLSQLHGILQIVMGWEDYHLHEFAIGRRLKSGGAVRNAGQLAKDAAMETEGAVVGNNGGALQGQALKLKTTEVRPF